MIFCDARRGNGSVYRRVQTRQIQWGSMVKNLNFDEEIANIFHLEIDRHPFSRPVCGVVVLENTLKYNIQYPVYCILILGARDNCGTSPCDLATRVTRGQTQMTTKSKSGEIEAGAKHANFPAQETG